MINMTKSWQWLDCNVTNNESDLTSLCILPLIEWPVAVEIKNGIPYSQLTGYDATFWWYMSFVSLFYSEDSSCGRIPLLHRKQIHCLVLLMSLSLWCFTNTLNVRVLIKTLGLKYEPLFVWKCLVCLAPRKLYKCLQHLDVKWGLTGD